MKQLWIFHWLVSHTLLVTTTLWEELVLLNYFNVKFFAVFDISFSMFLRRLLCLWICWCWIFLLFGKLLLIVSKWSTSTYKCKVVWCFINGDNNKVSMKFFQVLFNIRVAWYWISVIFSFTFPNTFPFHGLKFEVVYLVLSAIASIHLSRALVISINVLEKFIFWGFL